MKRSRIFILLLLCCCLTTLVSCGEEGMAQMDFTTQEMADYGTISPLLLEEIALEVPASCRYSEEVWEEYLTVFFATYPKVTYVEEGVISEEDTLCFYYSIAVGGEILSAYGEKDGSPLELDMKKGTFLGLDTFSSYLVGKEVGREIVFSLSIPHDHTISYLAGKEATFVVSPIGLRYEEVVSTFDSDYILNTLGWQTDITHPEEVVDTFVSSLKEELMAAYEEDLHHAIEDAIVDYLKGVYEPTALPMADVSYHFHALLNYYESMRLYDNEILTLWGSEEMVSPTLTDYLMRSFSCGAMEGYHILLDMAKEMTRENLAICAAYHALDLTITEEEYEEMRKLLAEELGEAIETNYVKNALMYEKTVAALLDSNRIKIIYSD